MRLHISRLKKHIIFHILYIIVAPLWNVLIFTKLIILRSEVCSDWPAIQCVWLAEYLKCVTEMLRSLPCCDVVCRCDDTKTIKPIINEAIVAFSEDIITDYNDSYGLFKCYAVPRNITMSAFVIGEMTNNKHYSTLLKTHVWISSSKFFKYRNIRTVSQKHQTVLATLELPHFIMFTAFHSVHIVGYSLPGSGNSPP